MTMNLMMTCEVEVVEIATAFGITNMLTIRCS